ncbi:hypothetical protein OG233_22430 [Streptomyces sp. NBC_01218]|uniref:hypothetical protein n=1 Tax=Streptomyces sp. NBC_01218 TaxID=2903780 RepID=UPI002E0EC459|nr:hypothetical protein OG233_22430 [Streptomyces sp. NBC_01218]
MTIRIGNITITGLDDADLNDDPQHDSDGSITGGVFGGVNNGIAGGTFSGKTFTFGQENDQQ